ncbi:MAG: hypothetical protein JSS96_10190 [Bacteroidetes bacterium]|nr:hypothetical protein [Bacteroidota bacterium]
MKKLNFLLLLFIPVIFISSCAKDIYMSYPATGEASGTIVLRPTKTTENTYVSIDSNLIVTNERVRSVTIHNIPDGVHYVQYTASNAWYQKGTNKRIPINIENGERVKKRVKVAYNNWEWANIGGQIALTALVAAALK